jgi:hypothetical protein
MNHDDFEERLQRQPPRKIPAEWREEILAAAAASCHLSPVTRHSFLSTLNSLARRSKATTAQLSTILWPHPVAWAGLAAIWLFIFAVDFSTRDNTPAVVNNFSPPPAEVIVEVRQQQRLLAEMMGPRDVREADRYQSSAPRPRSEFVEHLTT